MHVQRYPSHYQSVTYLEDEYLCCGVIYDLIACPCTARNGERMGQFLGNIAGNITLSCTYNIFVIIIVLEYHRFRIDGDYRVVQEVPLIWDFYHFDDEGAKENNKLDEEAN